MSEAGSEAFRRFVESVEGKSLQWREDVDVAALLSLEGEERRAAEELLMRELDENDTRAPRALAKAECRGAVAPMKAALPKASGRMKVAIALALAELDAGPADPIVAEVIRSGDNDSAPAAMAVAREMRSPEIRDALTWACMHHPTATARSSAGSILLYASGASNDPFVWHLRPLYLQLGSEDEATRRKAFVAICEIAQIDPSLADS
ncbi:hypothetical protein [Polyangium sp. 6x1]|uniref:hypothetical protein n=1 Tax=Polyangium sp. 6x1 TaxID=3042689 RepID=UPI002482F057|nr:hypothetical protein [Polyangium sp. 6x1]MDI1446205.1 hypothetical protein [Polyangium sp. 6x1]